MNIIFPTENETIPLTIQFMSVGFARRLFNKRKTIKKLKIKRKYSSAKQAKYSFLLLEKTFL